MAETAIKCSALLLIAYDFGPDLADVTAELLAKNGAFTPYKDGKIKVK